MYKHFLLLLNMMRTFIALYVKYRQIVMSLAPDYTRNEISKLEICFVRL